MKGKKLVGWKIMATTPFDNTKMFNWIFDNYFWIYVGTFSRDRGTLITMLCNVINVFPYIQWFCCYLLIYTMERINACNTNYIWFQHLNVCLRAICSCIQYIKCSRVHYIHTHELVSECYSIYLCKMFIYLLNKFRMMVRVRVCVCLCMWK